MNSGIDLSPALIVALFMSFSVGILVAFIGVWNLLVSPLMRTVTALEKRLDQQDALLAKRAAEEPQVDSGARPTLLPTGAEDIPLFGFVAREPSDTLPSAAPIG